MSEQQQNEVQAKLAELRQQVESLKQAVMLDEVEEELQAGRRESDQLGALMEGLRKASYAFADALQKSVTEAQSTWQTTAESMSTEIKSASDALKEDYVALLQQLTQAEAQAGNWLRSTTLTQDVSSGLQTLKDKVDQVSQALRARLSQQRATFEPLVQHLRDATWALQQFGASGIALQADENVLIASRAEWAQTGKGDDDPDGYLYVTNQRVIFEQSEKKGKFLGVFGGKKVQAELWAVPLAQITSLTTERKGIIGGKAMLTLTTAHADYPTLPLEIKGGFGNERMKKLLENAQNGHFGVPS